ncbi:hypothetical protein ACR6A7_11850 [Pantoea sp. RRHST58]|uniref:hypothetical protein n=1 Tax=Pantoea sp. RRHST58 TaxID=3425183 RepID=UPI003DA12EC8
MTRSASARHPAIQHRQQAKVCRVWYGLRRRMPARFIAMFRVLLYWIEGSAAFARLTFLHDEQIAPADPL